MVGFSDKWSSRLMERAMGTDPHLGNLGKYEASGPLSGYCRKELNLQADFLASVSKRCQGKSLSNISNSWMGVRPVFRR